MLREIFCICILCIRLTGGAAGAKPTSWTQTHSCHMVTLTTIQAFTLLLTLQTMESLRTGCRDTPTLASVWFCSLQSCDINDIFSSYFHKSILSYIFHNMFQPSLAGRCRLHPHSHTLRHSHTGIGGDSLAQNNLWDTLQKKKTQFV